MNSLVLNKYFIETIEWLFKYVTHLNVFILMDIETCCWNSCWCYFMLSWNTLCVNIILFYVTVTLFHVGNTLFL